MGLLEFNKLPINTLVGADWKTFNAITKGREIDAAYKGKFRLTKAVCRMLSTLAPLQDKRYEKLLADKPLEHDPVFILGHWRSGTTFVHNVFSCDKHFGYNTTYQTVFPHLMMWGQPFFKKKHELADARQASHGQYGAGGRPAAGGRVCVGEHDALYLL